MLAGKSLNVITAKNIYSLHLDRFYKLFLIFFFNFSSLIEIVNLFKLKTPEMKIVLQKEYEEYKDKSESYFQAQVIFAKIICEMDLQKCYQNIRISKINLLYTRRILKLYMEQCIQEWTKWNTSNFLTAVFRKFYLVHSWILYVI